MILEFLLLLYVGHQAIWFHKFFFKFGSFEEHCIWRNIEGIEIMLCVMFGIVDLQILWARVIFATNATHILFISLDVFQIFFRNLFMDLFDMSVQDKLQFEFRRAQLALELLQWCLCFWLNNFMNYHLLWNPAA